MKPQDLLFVVVFITLVALRKPVLFMYTGIVCLGLAIPLFATWTFFTAERLTWYGAAFIACYLLISLLPTNKVK